MAYGDELLDSIMEQVRGAQPRAQGRITQTSSFGIPPAAAPVAGDATPFYNRPIQLPTGVKSVGRRLIRGGGVLGAGMLGADLITDIIPNAVANAVVGKPNLVATVERGASGYGAKPIPVSTGVPTAGTIPAAAPAAPAPLEPVNAEEILRRNYASRRGIGAISLNGGPAVAIDTRGQAPEVAPTAASTGNFAGDFTGALLNLKQVSGDAALKVARAKAASAETAAQGTAARGAAALATSRISATLAAKHLEANPTDLAGAAAILHGRSSGGAGDKVFFPGIGPNDPTLVGDKRSGAVIARRPKVEAQMGKDAKGVWQILGPDGKTALRPATAEEIAQRNAGR